MAEPGALGSVSSFRPFIPWIAILLWWLVRLGTASNLPFEMGITLGVLSHFGLLISCCLFFVFQRFEDNSLIYRFKTALRPAILYALLASMSTVGFHHVVCAESTAFRKMEREQFIERSLADEEEYAVLQEEDERLAAMDRDTAKQRALEGLRFQFDPLWHFTASLLMWVAAAMTTSLFTAMTGQWLRG